MSAQIHYPLAFVRKAPTLCEVVSPEEHERRQYSGSYVAGAEALTPSAFGLETSFSAGRVRNEPADRFADAVYALNRLSLECERVGRRALFAFGRGVDGHGYCTDRREVARAIVHLESLPDEASHIAHYHARIARLAALAVMEPFPPETPKGAA